jgi:hypothetical protein
VPFAVGGDDGFDVAADDGHAPIVPGAPRRFPVRRAASESPPRGRFP